MYWRCKCGHKNPENSSSCGKCKSSENANKKFRLGALVSASIVFAMAYAAGISVGGTLLIFAVKPTEQQILAEANTLGFKTQYNEPIKSIFDLKGEQKEKAEAGAIAKAQAAISVVTRKFIYWIVPFLMFPLFGLIFGYTTTGRTVIEVSLGSVVGQAAGFMILKFVNGDPLTYLELAIGVAVAFGVVMLGETIGETFQERKERAYLDETRDSELAASAWSV